MVEQKTIRESTIEFEREEEPKLNFFNKAFEWIKNNLKFLLIPGYVSEDLMERQIQYEKTKSQRKFITRFKSMLTLIGITLMFIIISFAVFAPWLSPYSRYYLTTPQYGSWEPPSPDHPLGTGDQGFDVLGRIIWGARTSLTVALPALFIAVSGGCVIGIIASYYGGWIDSVLMRIVDIMLAFPSLVLVLFFIAIWGRRLEYFILAYGILGIAGYSRIIRGSVLQTKNLPYIDAARVSGAKNSRIMFRHIFPNVIQPIIVAFTFDIGGIILSLAGLSFLGFADTTLIEWGYDISTSRVQFYSAPWAAVWPGFMIMLTVLSFMLVGDGLRDALDPRMKNL
ncbi:MAG: ABC transporter permease [Promethearchaeota archaeon]